MLHSPPPLCLLPVPPPHQTHLPLPSPPTLAYVTAQNQQQYKTWLLALANSHEKLEENLQRIDQCQGEIEALCEEITRDIKRTKAEIIQRFEEFRERLRQEISEAIRETTVNAHRGDYQPTSPLASLIWAHSCQNSSDSISVFTYQIDTLEQFQPLLSLSFETVALKRCSVTGTSNRLRNEIEGLKAQLAEVSQREAKCIDHCHQLEKELRISQSPKPLPKPETRNRAEAPLTDYRHLIQTSSKPKARIICQFCGNAIEGERIYCEKSCLCSCCLLKHYLVTCTLQCPACNQTIFGIVTLDIVCSMCCRILDPMAHSSSKHPCAICTCGAILCCFCILLNHEVPTCPLSCKGSLDTLYPMLELQALQSKFPFACYCGDDSQLEKAATPCHHRIHPDCVSDTYSCRMCGHSFKPRPRSKLLSDYLS